MPRAVREQGLGGLENRRRDAARVERARQRAVHVDEAGELPDAPEGDGVEARLLERRRRAVGERGEEPQLGFREDSPSHVGEEESAEDLAARHQGDRDRRPTVMARETLDDPRRERERRVVEEVG